VSDAFRNVRATGLSAMVSGTAGQPACACVLTRRDSGTWLASHGIKERRRIGIADDESVLPRALHTAYNLISWRSRVRILALLVSAVCVSPRAHALPSFARQTGQKCAACHVSGSWPQLTPWGRFFKLSGYTAGKQLVDKEGFHYVPLGLFGQVGLTWAATAERRARDACHHTERVARGV